MTVRVRTGRIMALRERNETTSSRTPPTGECAFSVLFHETPVLPQNGVLTALTKLPD